MARSSRSFSSESLQPLLDAARPLVSHDPLGLCAAHQVVLMGAGHLARVHDAWWLSVMVDGTPQWLSEDLTLHARLPGTMTGAAINYYDACAQGWAHADGGQLGRQTDLLRPLGVGMRFTSSHAFCEEEFVQILWKYNCHERLARPICADLLNTGERTTTVQYHLLDRWPDMQHDLKALGIQIERVLPRLRATPVVDLSAQVSQLQQQFQSSQKRQGPRS